MRHLIFSVCLGVCFGILLGCAALSIWPRSRVLHIHKPPPQLAVVNMQTLVKEQSRHLAKTNAAKAGMGKVSARQLQEASEQLKSILEAFATEHNVILLSKGAVMGGELPDYTIDIEGLLHRKDADNGSF